MSDESDTDSMPHLTTDSDSGLDDSMFYTGDVSEVSDLDTDSEENEGWAPNNSDASTDCDDTEDEGCEWTAEDKMEDGDKNEEGQVLGNIEDEGNGNKSSHLALLVLFYCCVALYTLNCVMN